MIVIASISRKEAEMNNRERGLWIDNDEGLYVWWQQSRQPKQEFIKANRTEIDIAIDNVVSGRKRQHYLMYG